MNQFLLQTPLQIVEAEITDLEASISYNSLLADGCNLTCRGMKIILTSHTPLPMTEENTSTSTENVEKKSLNSSKETNEFDENFTDDSIGFIAQWIEIIIARLKLNIEDLHVLFLSKPCSSSEIALHMTFKNIMFHNSHPRLVKDDGGSLMAASSMYRSTGGGNSLTNSVISAMSNRKVSHFPFHFLCSQLLQLLTLETVELRMIADKNCNASLSIEQMKTLNSFSFCEFDCGINTDIQLSSTSALAYGTIDVDIMIPSLQMELKSSTIPIFFQV